jgi:sugar lactone lactonase YvrE
LSVAVPARLSRALLATALASLGLAVAGPAARATVPATVSTLAGDPLLTGPATGLSMPARDVLPYQGDVLVAAGPVVRRIDLDTGIATVFAGIGSGAYSTAIGDGGPATAAILEDASALAAGPDGSVYVVEETGNRVRRIAPDGTISTVAGKRSQGFSGDGGPGPAAQLFFPNGVAIAADGTVYISDTVNNRIRQVSPGGTISTFAGTGDEAVLGQPGRLVLDTDGSLLVADTKNDRIARVTAGVVTPVVIGLNDPVGIALDGDGYLVADTESHRIVRVDGTGGITSVAGNGNGAYGPDEVPATETSLFRPEAAVRLGDGRVAIADSGTYYARVVGTDGIVHGLGGNHYYGFSGDGGPAATAQLMRPHFLTVGPDGDAWFVDHARGTVVRRVDAATGTIDTVFGRNSENPVDGSLAVDTGLFGPRGLSVDEHGALFIADGNVIRRVDPATGQQRVFAGQAGVSGDTGDGGHRLAATFQVPYSVHAAPDGSVYVGDIVAGRVRRIAPDGTVSAFATVAYPNSITSANGVVYIGDDSGYVRAVDAGGTMTTVTDDVRPTSLVALPDGTLAITDMFANAVRRYDPTTGTVTTLAGDGLAGWRDGAPATARFAFPGGIGWDPLRDRLVVADMENARIRAVAFRTGQLGPAVAGPASLTYGDAVTVTGRAYHLDGTPKPGAVLTLQFQRPGTTTWTNLLTATSDADGRVSVTRWPRSSARYRWRYDTALGEAVSAQSGLVTVRAILSARWSPSSTTLGGTAYLVGGIQPGHPGETLYVQRRLDGVWRTVGRVTLSARSTYRYAYRAYDRRDPVLRVFRPADRYHPAAASPARTLVVS